MSSRLVTAFGLAALSAAIAAPAHAYVREETNWNPSSLPISYAINQATIPSTLGTAAGIAAVEGGFATWAAPTCTSWRATDTGNTTTGANTGDRHNVIMWLTSWPAELGDVNSVIGVTTPVWSSGGYFIDADIQFNAQHFRWNTTGTGGSSYVDAQSIATHEEGHFLGLDHTPVSTAIMYASYSGGLKRTLGSDDQNGVCTIYPSGVAASDSGVRPVDAGMPTSSDPCAAHGSTCDACTPYAGCGFCGSSSTCMSGTQTGAAGCGGGWVWFPMDCTAPTGTDAGPAVGAGRFGDPCMSPTDCSSGGICVGDGSSPTGFCTRACADDCSCPTAYTCYNAGSISVCIPGASTCVMGTDAGTVDPGNDAAVITPGEDAAVTPGEDSGTILPEDDASMSSTDDGGAITRRSRGGCACTAAGTRDRGTGAGLLALALIGLVTARRRRAR